MIRYVFKSKTEDGFFTADEQPLATCAVDALLLEHENVAQMMSVALGDDFDLHTIELAVNESVPYTTKI